MSLLVFYLLCAVIDVVNAQTRVNNMRLWHAPDKTRVVFDVSADVKHTLFSLDNPRRIVVDLDDASLNMQLPQLDPENKHLAGVRSGKPKPGTLRFVFELKVPLTQTSFILTPNELYGYRLVVDLIDPAQVATGVVTGSSGLLDESVAASQDVRSASVQPEASESESASLLKPVVLNQPIRQELVVAIDAGHGGEDPGAIGHRGSHEKKVTLEIAKRLKSVVDQDPRMRAVLIRDGDYYIDLHTRRQRARALGADLFVSIHADAFKRKSARGLSVFALSQSGATSAMARALAEKENASDLIGGVSLANKDEVLAKVLVDLSMTNTISESVNLGGRVLKELSKVGKLHSKRVEQAGFAVLKSPDMPSILIETGFITNPDEERNLKSAWYQKKLADAIYSAIAQYYDQTPYYSVASYSSPSFTDGPVAAATPRPLYHKVVRGDTLSTIAQKYSTSVQALKRENKLRSNVAVLGKRLKLPANAAAPAASRRAADIPREHIVRRGDSLSKISAKYNLTIRSIKAHNNLRSNTLIVGQTLKLPGNGKAAQSAPVSHKVRRGDTLSEIAQRYGSTEKKIMQANKMRNRTVMLGQTLTIPL